jgi:BTB/POZ domain
MVMNDFWKFRLSPLAKPPSSLVNDFRRLLNDPEMSDVCFLVEGKEVYGHRAILAIRSEYFRVLLFNGHMRESVENGSMDASTFTPIKLNDVSYPVFVKVLEYLYTDNVRDVELGLGIHLLIASEQFMLDRLKLLCEDIIRRDVNVSNVISILVTSHQHNAMGLKELAMEFILSNLNEKNIQKGLSDLKATPELLVEIIQLSSSTMSPTAHSAGSLGPITQHQEAQDPQRNVMGQSYQPVHGVEGDGSGNLFGNVDSWRPRR